jgi:phosphoribosyl 1,2-cyclic phosphodiesterase
MRIEVLGCRGSFPATGADFVRYGGDTASVAVAHDQGEAVLLLDAGTGLRNLDRTRAFRGTVLLSHWHWDHTHGIPFAPQLDHTDAAVTLVAPVGHASVRDTLRQALGPPHFPIRPEQLKGKWEFVAAEEHSVHEEFDVLALPIPHKGGLTLGYRIEAGGRSVAYLPDHALGREPTPEVVELCRRVDLLIHDGQHLDHEFPEVAYLGHTTVERAVRLAELTDAGGLLVFHHDPTRTDDDLDEIAASLPAEAVMARQGLSLEVTGRVSSGRS